MKRFVMRCAAVASMFAASVSSGHAFSAADAVNTSTPFGTCTLTRVVLIETGGGRASVSLNLGGFPVPSFQSAGGSVYDNSGGPTISIMAQPITAAAIATCLGTAEANIQNLVQDGANAAFNTDNLIGFGFFLAQDAGGLTAGVQRFTVGAAPLAVTVPDPAPTLLSIERSDPTQELTNENVLEYRVTFSEPVLRVDAADFTVVTGGSATAVINNVFGVGASYLVTVDGGNLASANDTFRIALSSSAALQDAAGNALVDRTVSGANQQYTVDNDGPSVMISTTASAPVTADFPVRVQIGDSPITGALTATAVNGFNPTQLVVNGATVVGTQITSANNFTVTLRPTATTVTVDYPANTVTDTAGNGNFAGNQLTLAAVPPDTTAPRLTSVTRTSPAQAATNADTLVFTATFDESVQGVAADDFRVISGFGTTANIAVAGSGATYTLTLTGGTLPNAANDVVRVGLATTATITDQTGNALTNFNPTGALDGFEIDNERPSVQITSSSSGSVNGDFPIELRALDRDLSQALVGIAGLDPTRLVVTGATIVGTITQTQPNVFSGTLRPTGGPVTVNYPAGVFSDAVGNSNAAATQFSISADLVAPTVTLSGPTTPQTALFTVEVSADEAITGLTLADFNVTNGTASNLRAVPARRGSSALFAVDITPVVGTTVTVALAAGAVTDMAANPTTAAATFSVLAGSPETEVARNLDQIIDTVQNDVQRNIQNDVNTNQQMIVGALDRFIESQVALDGTRDVPFDVTGSAELSGLNFSTKGTFFGLKNLGSGTTRLGFGDFNLTRDEDGSTSGQIAGRVVWERAVSEDATVGYFLGGRLGTSDLVGTFSGDASTAGVLGGAYGLTQFGEALFGTAYVGAGYSWSDLQITNGTVSLNGSYQSASFYAGAKVAGVIQAAPRVQIRPNVAVDYGYAEIGAVGLNATAFGLTNTVRTDFGSVSVLEGSVSPEMIFALNADQTDAATTSLRFAPSVICRQQSGRVNSSDCGGGVTLGLSSQSQDGSSRLSAEYEFTEVGGTTQQNLNLSLELQF